MVDFRPLLFANALALMLLVTAGFASVRDDLRITETFEPPAAEQVVAAVAANPETSTPPEPASKVSAKAEPPAPEVRSPVVDTTPFTVPPMPENPEVLAVAEPPAAMATRTDAAPTTQKKP